MKLPKLATGVKRNSSSFNPKYSARSGQIFPRGPESIPYNPKFPKAEYPYSQAPDGCSSWSDNPKQVRDSWPFLGGVVSFKEACDNHDRCYYTLGSSWQACNEKYFKDLTKACYDDLSTRVKNPKWLRLILGKYSTIPPDPVSLVQCESIALIYYTAVQAGVAGGVFEDAQKLQREYHDFVKQHCPECFPEPRRRPSPPTRGRGRQWPPEIEP